MPALDEATVALAAAQGVPAQRVAFRVTGDFRSDFKAFREMGRAKVGGWPGAGGAGHHLLHA